MIKIPDQPEGQVVTNERMTGREMSITGVLESELDRGGRAIAE